MNHTVWQRTRWLWVLSLSIWGCALVVLPITPLRREPFFAEGLGTALLVTAAGIFIVAVFEVSRQNKLLFVAGGLSGFFGFVGACYTLASENKPLLAFLFMANLYSLTMGVIATTLPAVLKTTTKTSLVIVGIVARWVLQQVQRWLNSLKSLRRP